LRGYAPRGWASDPVNVRQLIKRLSALPPEMPVYVDGYEWGIDDAEAVTVVGVDRGVYTDVPYAGDHAEEAGGNDGAVITRRDWLP
jgi:hypothetical protein